MTGLLTQKHIHKIPTWLWIIILLPGLIIILFLFGDIYPRSSLGRCVRWFKGYGLYDQYMHDLADDIQNDKRLSGLQNWAVGILNQFQDGTLSVKSSKNDANDFDLDPKSMPAFVSKVWSLTTNSFDEIEPQLIIQASNKGEPQTVNIAWYAYGVLIGAPDYRLLSYNSNLCMMVKPGIYVYHDGK